MTSFILTSGRRRFRSAGLTPLFYTNRRRSFDEVLPWDHMDYGIRKEFLMRENEKAHQSMTTPNCANSAQAAAQTV